ncbi:peptidylprolyl isomerase [Methanothermococcus okinawensis]|uniref:Peptidyl-prolyl cis-trans isomerase n=1 Tax=Methanothermococcus okinawensis (strain DSM 14208 / JCM 11175 / IH1) TaxID=647113 RepID=F8AKH6_METOI|nr:FKBP-type peptidyl-prolyl cis-trans isomerase [Methanothermococcus okinawensis]AEH07502.1 peptidylprolyl isomerase FKBP-type [Methanothermococcus okinawensis IH1]
MEKGKLVKISYNGYVNGKLFDTTDEELAKKEGIYSPTMIYGPVTVSVGSGMLVPGLDEALLEMEVGEERELELPPEKAFGKRDPSKVKIVSIKEFKKHKVNPVVGMPITIDGNVGKVASVNGGRVLVDFNHELAGKPVKYVLKVEEVVEEPEEIVKELIKLYMPRTNTDDVKIKLTKNTATINLPENTVFMKNLQMIKMAIANEIIKRLGVEKVSFVDTFLKKKEEKNEEKKE